MKKLSTKSLILCSLSAALIGIGAFIKIPIPLVPSTLQIFFTTIAALILGPKMSFISVFIYLLLGLIGIPVFTNGGGLSYIFQPTFGYIIGFLVGAYITGHISHKSNIQSFRRLIIASITGLAIVYIVGMVYFYLITNYYLNSSITVNYLIIHCCLIFIPGDVILCILSSVIAKKIKPILKKQMIIK